MQNKGITIPSSLQEFYVDSDFDLGITQRTRDEQERILNTIKNIHPIYQGINTYFKEETFFKKEGELEILNIITNKHFIFTDFDGKKHECIKQISFENHNLNGIKPSLVEVKRIQADQPRGPLCWKNQFKTKYLAIKLYTLEGKSYRHEYELKWEWEGKSLKDSIEGENEKEKLLNEIKILIDINANGINQINQINRNELSEKPYK